MFAAANVWRRNSFRYTESYRLGSGCIYIYFSFYNEAPVWMAFEKKIQACINVLSYCFKELDCRFPCACLKVLMSDYKLL